MNKLHKWCMNHKYFMIFLGTLLIFIGLMLDYLWGDAHIMALDALYHLFVILGEAIIVMFVLHIIIEEQNHHQHLAITNQILETQTRETAHLFKQLLEDMKEDLFAAFLKDKIPGDLIRVMVESEFFKPTFLRRNMRVDYTFRSLEGNFLHMDSKIEFDLEYVIGASNEMHYPMIFSLSDLPSAKYSFNGAGYRRYSSTGELGEVCNLSLQHFTNREFGEDKEKDNFRLTSPIVMKKNEVIRVFQLLTVKFLLQDTGIVDNFYVNHHTFKTDILVSFPKEYTFNIYPTFPDDDLPAPFALGTSIVYENIRFLVPGQGWGYSIIKN